MRLASVSRTLLVEFKVTLFARFVFGGDGCVVRGLVPDDGAARRATAPHAGAFPHHRGDQRIGSSNSGDHRLF